MNLVGWWLGAAMDLRWAAASSHALHVIVASHAMHAAFRLPRQLVATLLPPEAALTVDAVVVVEDRGSSSPQRPARISPSRLRPDLAIAPPPGSRHRAAAPPRFAAASPSTKEKGMGFWGSHGCPSSPPQNPLLPAVAMVAVDAPPEL
ncbi:hypothetical protein ACLOJK_011706 [Asimina triloba]